MGWDGPRVLRWRGTEDIPDFHLVFRDHLRDLYSVAKAEGDEQLGVDLHNLVARQSESEAVHPPQLRNLRALNG